jgi:hypothetical protein
LYAYLYLTIGYAIYRRMSRLAALAFLALQLWFTCQGLFPTIGTPLNVIPAVLLVAAVSAVRGTFGYNKSERPLTAAA